HDADIRPVLFLGALAVCVPTALLIAARSSTTVFWGDMTAHMVLSVATAAASAVICNWLAKEARVSKHPSLALLAASYGGVATLSLVRGFQGSPVHLALLRSAMLLWVILCGIGVVSLILAAPARRWVRARFLASPMRFYVFLGAICAALCTTLLALDGPVFHSAENSHIVNLLIVTIAATALPSLAIVGFLIYRRKRNPVILFFNLGLYLYALAVVGTTAAPQWSLPWWIGHSLELVSAFSVAYGVMESNRMRDRLNLIGALAARSQELQKSHADLAHSELRYRSMVNNAPYGVVRLNHWERFDAVNPALLEALGYGPMHPCTWLPMFSDLFRERDEYINVIQELRRSGRTQREIYWKRNNGTAFKVRLQCRRTPGASNDAPWFEGIVEDLSEQSSLEEQLRQSQKMEAI